MARTTVDFGIDLGTTNSCIAVLQGTQTEVIRNNANLEYSPSAIWVDRKGRMHVGQKAKDEYERDPENASIEFKLLMGTAEQKTFQRSGQVQKPEELSAEVLKSLLGDVRQRRGEQLTAAVITVPAAFELPQCDATRRAAQLAGLNFSPLLQEPVAAALAYGFQSASEKVYWLVYDLGGGTFDAALMKLQDGMFRVVNHGGDNHLGGKYLDWAIVDKVLAPAVAQEFHFTDFNRQNPAWRGAFALLKHEAELAKIRLSREDVTEISRELIDKAGERFQFDFELRRADVEELLEVILERSINICRKVLTDKRLGAGDVEKILLVGGPTLTPMLRQRLADPKEGLGIALDFSQDPMTVVARGAAIFAGTQKMKEVGKPQQVVSGQFSLELEHQPVGSDPEPLVGGKVVAAAGQSLAGFTIEFLDNDARPPWRSGKIALNASAVFTTTLRAEKGRGHNFVIELRDASGRLQPVTPASLSYTIGNVAAAAPLIHSLGIAMANNKMDVILQKGTSLPAKNRSDHRSTAAIHPAQKENAIRIPIIEGENFQRAELNRKIGEMLITGEQVKRTIPANTPIEITLEMDESRLLTARALILDEEYEMVIHLGKAIPDVATLQGDFRAEQQQWQTVRQKASTIGDKQTLAVLDELDREGVVQEIEGSLAAASGDPDAAQKCQNRLLDLKSARARIEDALEWPDLEAQATVRLRELKTTADQSQNATHRQQAAALEKETRQAMTSKAAHILRQKLFEVDGLIFAMLWQQPSFCIAVFQDLCQRPFPDPHAAQQLIQAGNRAILDNALDRLQTIVRQLIGLLPIEQQKTVGYGGTTIR